MFDNPYVGYVMVLYNLSALPSISCTMHTMVLYSLYTMHGIYFITEAIDLWAS